MKYGHIVEYVSATPWAITTEKLHELLGVLAFRAAGHRFTAEEIQARLGAAPASTTASTGSGVAIVPIRGVIAHRMGGMQESSGGTSVDRIRAMVRQVAADPAIGTIVYDIDSPGGTVPGVQELAAELFALRGQKTQIAVANDLMASSAYWVGSQADEVVSTPSGSVGSIGVFAVHEDLSKLLEQEGVTVTLLSAGKYKTEGNPFEPLNDEAKAHFQGRVDDSYREFVKAVARGRGVTPEAVREGYGQGRVLRAAEAKTAGLIDRVATLEETVRRVVGRRREASMMAAEADRRLALEWF